MLEESSAQKWPGTPRTRIAQVGGPLAQQEIQQRLQDIKEDLYPEHSTNLDKYMEPRERLYPRGRERKITPPAADDPKIMRPPQTLDYEFYRSQASAQPRIRLAGDVPTGDTPQWPGTPVKPQWPGTPAQQPQSRPAGAPTQITVHPRSFYESMAEQAGKGVEQIKEAVTQPSVLPTRIPKMLGGAATILGAPIEAASEKVEEWFPSLKKAQQQGQILPLERPGDIAFGALGMGETRGLKAIGEGVKVADELAKIITPGGKEAAQAAIRKETGLAARDTAQTAAAFEPYHRVVNALPREQQVNFIHRVEGVPGFEGPQPTPQLGKLEGVLSDALKLRRTKLEAMPSTAKMEFVEKYYPHMFQNPAQAEQVVKGPGGYGRIGSGASLKARTVPTIADGIARGLVPVTTDPIETVMRYVNSMDRFIAQRSVLDTAKGNGTVRYVHPQSIGASGHPDAIGGGIPEGWEPLQGRGAVDMTGAQAYAPGPWARVYNNYVSRGIHDWAGPVAGNVYEKLRRASNSITAAELSLSGFHAFNMAQEAIITDLGRGIKALTKGQLGTAGKAFARAPIAPYKLYKAGKKAEQVYLGHSPGTLDMRRVINEATAAGMRGVGRAHAPDYRMSSMGNMWTSFRRGALAKEMGQSLQNIKANPILGVASEAFKLSGRIMETMTAPLFEKYIPRLKNGAVYEELRDWMEAHPNAGPHEINRAARTIVDTVDDRFGEVIQDNVFWNQTFKQLSQLSLRSFSWDLGTARLFIQGTGDLMQTAAGRKELSSRAAVLLAMPFVWGALNALYQGVKTAIKTGKPIPPQSIDDLMAGRTGGEAPGASIPSAKPFGKSSREIVDERVMMPGYMKDIFAWYYKPYETAMSKRSTMLTAGLEALTNTDWRGLPIADVDKGLLTAVEDYYKWASNTFGSFTLRQFRKGEKTGSAISPFEQLLGVRPAPSYLADPGGYALGGERRRQQAIKHRQAVERKEEQLYGGTQE